MKKKSVTPGPVSRRNLLKQAASTLPVIATLPSGAAHARTSNLLSLATDAPESAIDGDGLLCLDTTNVAAVEDGRVDLGGSQAHAFRIPVDNQYRRNPGDDPVVPADVCTQGGRFVYNDTSTSENIWREFSLPGPDNGLEPGLLVSANALTSFAADITDIGSISTIIDV